MRILSALLISLPVVALADGRRAPDRLEVTSAFAHGDPIQDQYTCDGADVSPPLRWSAVPARTQSIAILVDDPDAPGGKRTHWLVTGIAPTTTQVGLDAMLPPGAIASVNDNQIAGYSGPCPPSGRHRYEFRVYALDIPLREAMTRSEFVNAITDHIVATGHVIGTYRRRP